MMAEQSGMGITGGTTGSAGNRGKRRLDSRQHEPRRVHGMGWPAPAAATICTGAADELNFNDGLQP